MTTLLGEFWLVKAENTPGAAACRQTQSGAGQPPTVDRGRNRLVVGLVQDFDGQAAVDSAIADGMAGDNAQVLGVYVHNQNPRLWTLPLAGDLRLDLRGGDCEAPVNHQLVKLATDARAMSGSVHT
jgi:hypothetical protein